MIYTFENISTAKFSINGRTLWKTFIPVYINEDYILIYNIYDCKCPLIRSTKVVDIEVDGVVYPNATDLINNIHEVLFSRAVGGDIDNEQIELNRLAIIELQDGKANVVHNHDGRYYTQSQIDDLLSDIVSGTPVASGQVDGNIIRFYDVNEQELFTINAEAFNSQGTTVVFEDGILQLRSTSGELLSSTPVKAKEQYYDTFEFQDNIEDDLNDLIQDERYTLAKTISELYFFVSDKNNVESFDGARIYINELEMFFDLTDPDIESTNWYAWLVNIPDESFVFGSNYEFNFWYQRSATSIISPYVSIDSFLVKKGTGNTNMSAIEVGDQIQGNLNATTYVIADVLALPYDDENNLEFYLYQQKG